MDIKEAREVFNVFRTKLDATFDSFSALELFTGLKEDYDFHVDIDGAEYRLIQSRRIDDVMQDELDDDHYMLGCCNAWFIADITGLSIDDIEKAQKADSMQLLGALMAKDLELVQESMVSADGYGHHFSSYDGSEYEVGDWYIFRIN